MFETTTSSQELDRFFPRRHGSAECRASCCRNSSVERVRGISFEARRRRVAPVSDVGVGLAVQVVDAMFLFLPLPRCPRSSRLAHLL